MYKIYQFFKIGILVSCLLPWTICPSVAQHKKPEKVQVFYDRTAVPEIFQQIPIGFTFTFPDGSTASTRGFLQGNIRWKSVHVRSSQGTVHNGSLHFSPEKVWHNHHRATFRVSYADTTLYCELMLPYLQKIHFNLYTDSIKRGVPFYLNIEGTFSSGQVYPLDTGKLLFYASDGKLTNNVLQLSQTDSATKKIFLKSMFKWDSTIADSSIIPVKMHHTAVELPTEEELFRQWKKQRRRN